MAESGDSRWLPLCVFDGLEDGVPELVECEGDYFYVTREGHGVRVFDALCPHHATNLSFAPLQNDEVECPLHGWRFDVTNGACIRGGRDLVERKIKVQNNTVFALMA